MHNGAGASSTDRPHAVLWDMDGTLVDSEPLWGIALDEFARSLGGELTEEVRESVVGTDSTTTMRIVTTHLGVQATDAQLDHWHDGIVEHVLDLLATRLEPLPDALSALDALEAEKIPMALVTSSPRAVAESALTRLGRERFAVVITAEDVERRKPDPEPYLKAARLLEVDPERTWAVEDSPSGATSADAAGCTVFLAPGAGPAAAAPGRIVLDSLAELA